MCLLAHRPTPIQNETLVPTSFGSAIWFGSCVNVRARARVQMYSNQTAIKEEERKKNIEEEIVEES